MVEASSELANDQSATIAYDAVNEDQPGPEVDGLLVAQVSPEVYLPASLTDTPWAFGGYWG